MAASSAASSTSSAGEQALGTAAAAAAAAAAPAGIPIVICIVVDSRKEVSLMCSISLLRLQQDIMTQGLPVRTDIHFVATLDEALNVLHSAADAKGMFVVRGTMGFESAFVLSALASELPLVVATYPLPTVDWERVKTQPATESAKNWGNTYSVKGLGGTMRPGGYVQASEAHLGAAWVAKSVVTDLVARTPSVVTKQGDRASFAAAGVYDGQYLTEDQRFLSLYGGEVWADIQRPATSSGPTEFAGCVGARAVLR